MSLFRLSNHVSLLFVSFVSFQGFKNAYINKYEYIFFCFSLPQKVIYYTNCSLYFSLYHIFQRFFHLSTQFPHSFSHYMVFHCVDGLLFFFLIILLLMNLGYFQCSLSQCYNEQPGIYVISSISR